MVEHARDLGELFTELRIPRQVVEVACQDQLVFEFACGTSGDAEESRQLPFSTATATLGGVGGDRGGGLRVHGLIKRIGHRYKYYLTELGRRVVVTGLKLRQLFVLPQLATAPA